MRVRTSSKLRLIVALLLFPTAMGLTGFMLWATMEHNSPSYWLAYMLTMVLSLMGGKKLGAWARKGKGGPDEECPHCGHHLRSTHHSWADYACNKCDCNVLTTAELKRVREEGKRLDALIAAEKERARIIREATEELRKHPHG
jgi:hypothetical protein